MAKKSTTILYWSTTNNALEETPHRHTYSLDSAGNGTTSFVEGHSHTIESWEMEKKADHKHGLTDVVSSGIDTVPEDSTDTSEAIILPEEDIASVPVYASLPVIRYNTSCGETEIESTGEVPFFKATQTVSYIQSNTTTGDPTSEEYYDKIAQDKGYKRIPGKDILGNYQFTNNNSEQHYFNIDIDNVELLTNKSKSNLDYSSFYLKALFDYNFLSKKYEEGINVVPDSALPNQYGLILTTLANDSGIEISNWLNEIYDELGFSVSPSKNEKTANDVFETYLERFSALAPKKREVLTDHMKNVIFPASSRDIMEEGMIEHFSFPMSTNIEFNTDSSTQFAQSLQNAKLGSALINYAQDGFSSDTSEVNVTIKREISLTDDSIQETTSPKRTISISDWWKKDWFGSSSESNINLEDQFFVGYKTEENASENDINNVTNKFAKIISWIAFAGGLKQIIRDRFISNMCDIFDGKKETYSEDVIYKISKFAGISTDGEELQNFWFSNSNEIDVIRFFDTQVKFNTDYTYKLTTYKMAIGTRYESKDFIIPDYVGAQGEFIVKIKYDLEPDVRLIEIDQLTFGGKIIDDPPVAPEVNFIPYRGVNNKVLLSLDSAVGEYNLVPITFNDLERDLINQIRIAQAKPTGEIRFSSDEGTKSFEVYRMEDPPQNYNSFANNLLYTLSSQDYSSAEIIDNIEPNKKYYYTFRSVDYHNKISNPSAVFEYILIDADGAVYPELKIYDFNTKSPKVATKSMKKLLRVVPTFAQSAVNYNSTDFDLAPALGTTGGESLFSSETNPSKFKIRLTSKRSGKQIDFNVAFILKEKK